MNGQIELKPYVIGLDLGGTNSVFGVVDSRGEIKNGNEKFRVNK